MTDYLCVKCGLDEPEGVMTNGEIRIYEPVGDFMCSRCTQKIVNSNEKISWPKRKRGKK